MRLALPLIDAGTAITVGTNWDFDVNE